MDAKEGFSSRLHKISTNSQHFDTFSYPSVYSSAHMLPVLKIKVYVRISGIFAIRYAGRFNAFDS